MCRQPTWLCCLSVSFVRAGSYQVNVVLAYRKLLHLHHRKRYSDVFTVDDGVLLEEAARSRERLHHYQRILRSPSDW